MACRHRPRPYVHAAHAQRPSANRRVVHATLLLLSGCGQVPPPSKAPSVAVPTTEGSLPTVPEQEDDRLPAQAIALTVRLNETARAPGGVSVTLTQALASIDANGALESAYVKLALAHVSNAKSPDRQDTLILGKGPFTSDGEERMTRTWCGLRFHLVDAPANEQQVTVRIEGRYALAPVQRIATGERKVLAPGAEVTFTGHSHKQTMQGGPESPLMISLIHHGVDEDLGLGFSLQLTETHAFDIGAQTWELVDYAYDSWMDLRLIGTP